ncbi:PorP/SprF family type IX secretion system membrane protein [Flammeovirga kamogawensis]|uniref:Type IX secretion system membrane protein PorP/SprF n=1 Tax=Flammeovirga kamogawensis TaxID=373891 RepID=A0ABX8H3J5_9BACT|nr:type IX secretion system membrane protein PorP/SprF [Flammeovirga kamogawensis]MBB6460393.1 type IX secretion system PorP/SprF family membrane protein [Flammeovirga kamogawensis]QWG10199.1 type IX secretion system membrane protein PorP/SprF [Flammeovirga kamogawensis]TRX64651.1 type IX secretion system membrane protein PorP/SprF [Flammeovirga kamogawensis]
MKNLLISIILLLNISVVFAQQDPIYSQYMFNTAAINPAYAGASETVSINVLHRSHWVSMPGAPKTNTFTATMPIAHNKLGLGVFAMNDEIGVFKNTQAYGMLSYHLPVSYNGKLSFGLQFGFNQYRGNLTEVKVSSNGKFDPAFANNISKTQFNTGAGVWFQTTKFYAGVSIPRILDNRNVKKNSNEPITIENQMHAYFMTGVVLDVSKDIKVKPSTLIKYVENNKISYDLNTTFYFQEKISLGFSYRDTKSLVLMSEVQATKNIRIGYSYDMSLSEVQNVSGGSHEVMLRYELKWNKTQIMTPRFF